MKAENIAADRAPRDAGGPALLKLVFYNVTPPDSIEILGEAFTLAIDTILKNPSGEEVAKYSDGEWCVADKCFLRIECRDPVIFRFGADEQSGARHGPYRTTRLIDGVLLGDETPMAALHPAKGWLGEPIAQALQYVRLEPALTRRSEALDVREFWGSPSSNAKSL